MKKILFLPMFLIVFTFCKNNDPKIINEASLALPEDFISFYDKFHQDSLFQIEHCIFPMEGLPDQMDSTVDHQAFRWTKDIWRMHHLINDSFGLTKSYTMLGDNMITERMLNEKQGIGIERRFARMNNDWNLIYYVGLNQYKKNK